MAKSVRSTGTATITFGLVSAPAKLYAATESKDAVSFNLLHGACRGRLKQQYVCAGESCGGKVVDRDQMVKGYEYEKDRYVAFTAEEIEAIQAQASEAIDVVEFVPAGAVDPVYFEKSSYLAPDKGGQKAFALIVEAMRRSGRHAIGKYAARGRQHVVLLRPAGSGMIVHTLRYADEVRDPVEVPSSPVDAGMVDLAVRLIEARSSATFDPTKYRDEVRDRMLEAIRAKVEGGAVPAPVKERGGEVVDLMAALRASLAAKAA